MTAPTTRETADHAELAAELRAFESSDDLGNGDFTVCEFAADALEAALSEIAALRGERDRLKLAICGGEDVPGAIDAVTVEDCEGFIREERQRHDGLLTQAERQRDELRKATETAAGLFKLCTEPTMFENASTLNVYAPMTEWLVRNRPLISNQGAE